MPLVPAICPQCNAKISIDDNSKTAFCSYCGTSFVSEKAINNYNVTNNFPNANVSITQDSEYEHLRNMQKYYSENGDKEKALQYLYDIEHKYPYKLTREEKEQLDNIEKVRREKQDILSEINSLTKGIGSSDTYSQNKANFKKYRERISLLEEKEKEIKQSKYADDPDIKEYLDRAHKILQQGKNKTAEDISKTEASSIIYALVIVPLMVFIFFLIKGCI